MKVLQAAEIDKLEFECHLGVAYKTRLAFCSAKRKYGKKGRREKIITPPYHPTTARMTGTKRVECTSLFTSSTVKIKQNELKHGLADKSDLKIPQTENAGWLGEHDSVFATTRTRHQPVSTAADPSTLKNR